MKTNIYNKLYIKELIFVLKDQLKDLDKWSVYNDDLLNDEISKLEEILDKVREKIIG